MNATAVVSCPRCLRQYQIDPTTERVVAQCGVCKAHFAVAVSRLTGPADDTLVLDQEIEPHINFYEEGCEEMAKHACAYMAGEVATITPSSLVAFIMRLTDDKISEQVRRNFSTPHHVGQQGGGQRAAALAQEYFVNNVARKSGFARFMLRSAFAGMLRGIDWTRFIVNEQFDLLCPVCRKQFKSGDERRGKCPRCQTNVQV